MVNGFIRFDVARIKIGTYSQIFCSQNGKLSYVLNGFLKWPFHHGLYAPQDMRSVSIQSSTVQGTLLHVEVCYESWAMSTVLSNLSMSVRQILWFTEIDYVNGRYTIDSICGLRLFPSRVLRPRAQHLRLIIIVSRTRSLQVGKEVLVMARSEVEDLIYVSSKHQENPDLGNVA
jgi:hypothetical protein